MVDKFKSTIPDENRRKFAGMLTKLDESVGKVVEALQETGELKNSVIVFTTDNGGPAAGFDVNAASNWPLRGVRIPSYLETLQLASYLALGKGYPLGRRSSRVWLSLESACKISLQSCQTNDERTRLAPNSVFRSG